MLQAWLVFQGIHVNRQLLGPIIYPPEEFACLVIEVWLKNILDSGIIMTSEFERQLQ